MKRFTSMLATVGIASSVLMPAVQAVDIPLPNFNDVNSSHANSEAIDYLKTNNIVEGYEDGSFQPAANINRAEFIKIATLMIDGVTEEEAKKCTKSDFKDVPSDVWFAKYVCVAKDKGLVKGYEDGTFRPERKISYAEASKIILMVFDKKETEDGEQWYTNYVSRMEALKAIPKTILSPHYEITRGDMAEVIWRIDTGTTDRESRTLNELEGKAVAVSGAEGTKESTEKLATEPFPAIASCIELSEKFATFNNYGGGIQMLEDSAMPTAAPRTGDGDGDAAVSETSAESKVAAPGGSSNDDFSQTNIQVQGVDEADIIKNDGQYIYMVRQDTVRIVKANPVENMVELSKLSFKDLNFNPTEIYLAGEKLVVVGNTWTESAAVTDAREILPRNYGHSRVKVYVIDIKDRTNPVRLREVSLQGNYSSSRRVGDHVYLVMNDYPNYYGGPVPLDGEDLVPVISDSKVGVAGELSIDEPMVGCNDIHYFPGFQSPNYLIVAGVPIADMSQSVEREVILGASENIYSSAKNLYVASTDYNYGVMEPVVDIVGPAPAPTEDEGEKTLVYKFGLDKGKVSFKTTGKVPGTILNQFSMDEAGDNFRIATTKGNVWESNNKSTNNLYVLDKEMQVVGKIEDIAPGERIYSTRFLGNRGYMVTFKKVDPLFVFDLTDPKNPKILGKLKIPGFSDYLHPYDENHIIGFGKDTVEATEDETSGRNLQFAWYQGMKIAMFDITDVQEPKQQFVEIIGDRGTDSELLWNHKALLFDKDKELMAFPVKVAELSEEQKAENTGSAYGETVFDGAYVYTVNLQDGFKLRGKVHHYDNEDVFQKSGDYFYGDYGRSIQRIIYIGEYLYTISPDVIKALTIDTVQEKNKVQMK